MRENRLIGNKICAVLLVVCTLPVIFFEKDATATIVMLIFAVPMFLAKQSWIYGSGEQSDGGKQFSAIYEEKICENTEQHNDIMGAA